MSAYNRVQWLHNQIIDGRFPNAKRVSEHFGISHRQGQRDIEALKKDFGAPLKYDAEKKGYTYSASFSLPVYFLNSNEEDYLKLMSEAQSFSDADADENSYLQMQIPYLATIEIPDRRSYYMLERFVVGKEVKNNYICEFRNANFFLCALLTSGADFRIKKPLWLRDKLFELIERTVSNNKEEETEWDK